MWTVGQSGINGQTAGIPQQENIPWEKKVKKQTCTASQKTTYSVPNYVEVNTVNICRAV